MTTRRSANQRPLSMNTTHDTVSRTRSKRSPPHVSSIDNGSGSLQRDHDSPCTKDVRSSLVAMASPINSLLPGRKSPAWSVGGTQNRSSESGPNIQPSFMAELSVKEADILLNVLMMNMISEGPILLRVLEYPYLGSTIIAPCTRIVMSSDPETIRCPSGENATDMTEPLWPLKVPPSPHQSQHPTLGSSCHQSQKRCGVHLART